MPGMMYKLQTKIANKELKQATQNQLQEQLQFLSFQERYNKLLSTFLLDRLLWQTGNQLQKYNIRDKKSILVILLRLSSS